MITENGVPAAIVCGGSSGLGAVIARRLLRHGYSVTILGRNSERLASLRDTLVRENTPENLVHVFSGDAVSSSDMHAAVESHLQAYQRLDLLVNVVGRSDRGLVEELDSHTIHDLIDANVVATLNCSQACLPALRERRGVIVNIGSLASHVCPRYLGGYSIAKHALRALTRQMRMECTADGVHVGLVSPGPIRIERRDSADRYEADQKTGVPTTAAGPGGGAKVKLLEPEVVADAVLRCALQRKVEVIMPAKTRLLMAIDAVSPRLADWILSRKSAQ